jgi:hypothetical protein
MGSSLPSKKPITVKEIKSRYQTFVGGASFTIWREGGTPVLNRLTSNSWDNTVKTNTLISEGTYRIGMDFIPHGSFASIINYLPKLPESLDEDVVTINKSYYAFGNNTYPGIVASDSDYFINFLYST